MVDYNWTLKKETFFAIIINEKYRVTFLSHIYMKRDYVLSELGKSSQKCLKSKSRQT